MNRGMPIYSAMHTYLWYNAYSWASFVETIAKLQMIMRLTPIETQTVAFYNSITSISEYKIIYEKAFRFRIDRKIDRKKHIGPPPISLNFKPLFIRDG